MLKTRPPRFWAFVTSVALALSGIVGLNVTVQQPQPAKALSGSSFDPGLIIGDSVFYDFGATDAPSLQAFMDQQVPNCKSGLPRNPAPGDYTCLRYYRTDIPAMAADANRCDAIAATPNQTVAQMLVIIGRACNINPRVLLVTLQKEQGLVTSTNPYWPDASGGPSTTRPQDYRYQIAMGFNCPDSAPCSTFGFFYQVYKAASQFHWYGNPSGSFTYLKVGKDVSVSYQANSSTCGKRTFTLKSQATAALYYYTPYTPNAAALSNLYGSGDKCSAYGNRNFWRYYWDWFGSPVGGGFLLQSATSGVYLITPDPASGNYVKHLVPDATLAKALAPLGPIGRISQDYLDSFASSTDMNRLVKSATGAYFFVEGGRKYVVSSCDQAGTYGLSCSSAVQLSAYQLNAMPSSGTISALVPDVAAQASGPSYLISGGLKHEILDSASVTASGISLPAQAPVGISAFAYLPWGAPIAKDGELFKNRTTGGDATIIDGKYYPIDPATSADMDFKQWFTPTAGSLSAPSLAAIDSGLTVQSIVQNPAGQQFVITPLGRRLLVGDTAPAVTIAALPESVLNHIPLQNNDIKLPILAKSTGGKATYFIANQVKRSVFNSAAVIKLSGLTTDSSVQILPQSALQLIASGASVFAPATALVDSYGHILVTDGLAGYRQVSSAAVATLLGFGKQLKVTKADLADYTSAGSLGYRINCESQQYLALNGVWQPINPAYAAAFPGVAVTLDSTSCAYIKKGTVQLGRFVTSPLKFVYLMSAGKRRLVSAKQYELLRGTTPASFKIDATLAGLLPLGVAMPASYKTPIANPDDVVANPTPTPSASASSTPTSSPTPSVKPTATPTPTVTASPKPSSSATPTPTPTPTPSPTTTATTAKTYTVVSGDTLTKIALKFAITVAALKAANGLTSDVIQLGRKLVIP